MFDSLSDALVVFIEQLKDIEVDKLAIFSVVVIAITSILNKDGGANI